MNIVLLDGIPACGGMLATIHLRVPDERLARRILAARIGGRVPLDRAAGLAATLAVLGVSTLRRLSDRDLARLAGALERLVDGGPRLIATGSDRRA